MEFNYTFYGSSHVQHRGDRTALSFAPDIQRAPTYFTGELRQGVAFREAISALHDVVVSDLRWKPKDKDAYKAWAAQQELIDWEQVAIERAEVSAQLQAARQELNTLNQRSTERMAPFYKARKQYFDYLYQKNKDAWFVLDPVITVHPDEVFFECFSQDESSYGRLGASYEVFQNIGDFACGTTNIDYSSALYDEFQKIRSYKTTRFEIDPAGFEVQTSREDAFQEVKIDLPESWVRGFLQVNSAMSLPALTFDLQPIDVQNLCFVLRRHRELKGPRGLRYHLTPGEPIRVVLEPWEKEIRCPRSIYTGPEPRVVRLWGRRRLHILERLVPVARRFTVHLLGTGMPSFYVADLGDLSFTLGLSGWTANDWSSSGNFDLMAPRAHVDGLTAQRVFDGLKGSWLERPEVLAAQLKLDPATVLGALSLWSQAGRVMYDLHRGVYRARELSREPLPLDKLRFSNERESQAVAFLEARAVRLLQAQAQGAGVRLEGSVQAKGKVYQPVVVLDGDQRLIEAQCSCNWYQQNKLFKGPCEHMLALRTCFARRG